MGIFEDSMAKLQERQSVGERAVFEKKIETIRKAIDKHFENRKEMVEMAKETGISKESIVASFRKSIEYLIQELNREWKNISSEEVEEAKQQINRSIEERVQLLMQA